MCDLNGSVVCILFSGLILHIFDYRWDKSQIGSWSSHQKPSGWPGSTSKWSSFEFVCPMWKTYHVISNFLILNFCRFYFKRGRHCFRGVFCKVRGQPLHAECFVCATCNCPLKNIGNETLLICQGSWWDKFRSHQSHFIILNWGQG